MTEQALRRPAVLFGALLLGAGVSVALGCYGRLHTPAYGTLPSFGFSSSATFKAWLGTGVLALATVQVVTALWMYGLLPLRGRVPRWLGPTHRISGAVAVVLSLPGTMWLFSETGIRT